MKPVQDATASDLPFLIIHGGSVWKVLLALLLIVSTWFTWLIVRRRARKARARRLALHYALATTHDLSSIEGTARGNALTVSQRDITHSDHSSGLHLITDQGERIEVVGAVHVHIGTNDVTQSWLSRDVPERLREGFDLWSATTIRKISDGDRVVVAGTRSKESVASRADAPVLVTAVSAVRRWPTLLWAAAVASLFAAFWTFVLYKVGAHALEITGDEVDIHSHAAMIAASMPGSREQLLEKATDTYMPLGRHPERVVRDQIALAAMRGECPDIILMNVRRPVEALAAARRCAPERAYRPMLMLGMYEEAAGLDRERMAERAAMVVALATDDWRDAAARIEGMLERQSKEVRTDLECYAAMLRVFAGELAAFERLTSHDSAECKLFRLLSRPVGEWKAGLESLELPDNLFGVAHELWVVSGGHESYADDDFGVSLPTALAKHSTSELAPVMRGRRAALLGDFDSSSAEFKYARAKKVGGYDLYVAETELAYRSGGRWLAPVGAREKLDYRFDRVLKTYLGDCGTADMALGLARGGDGRLLGSTIERCRGGSLIGLAEVAAQVKTGRSELAHALRWSKDDELRFGIRFPFDVVVSASWFRDVARILGDRDEADALAELVARHMRVLEDPRRAVALRFWAEWTWSWNM